MYCLHLVLTFTPHYIIMVTVHCIVMTSLRSHLVPTSTLSMYALSSLGKLLYRCCRFLCRAAFTLHTALTAFDYRRNKTRIFGIISFVWLTTRQGLIGWERYCMWSQTLWGGMPLRNFFFEFRYSEVAYIWWLLGSLKAGN